MPRLSSSSKGSPKPPTVYLISSQAHPFPLFEATVSTLQSFDLSWNYLSFPQIKSLPPKAILIVAATPVEFPQLSRLPAALTILWPQEGPVGRLTSLLQAATPLGIPLARVAIGSAGGVNSALLAVSLLALKNPALRRKLSAFRKKQTLSVLAHPIPGNVA